VEGALFLMWPGGKDEVGDDAPSIPGCTSIRFGFEESARVRADRCPEWPKDNWNCPVPRIYS